MRSSKEVKEELEGSISVPKDWVIGRTRDVGTAEVRLGDLGDEKCVVEVIQGDDDCLISIWHRDVPSRWSRSFEETPSEIRKIPGEVIEIWFPSWTDGTRFVEQVANEDVVDELARWRNTAEDERDDWGTVIQSIVGFDVEGKLLSP